MLVLMNPGSSYPLNGIDHGPTPSQAQPDSTQYQVMNLMRAISIDYARVLNLSDLRTPDSNALYEFLASDASKSIDHCIFSPTRRAELVHVFQRRVPVVYGWGVNKALVPLARLAMSALSVRRPLGIAKPDAPYSYYHPLPRVYARQVAWVQAVAEQFAARRHAQRRRR